MNQMVMDFFSRDGATPVNDLFTFLEGQWQLSRTINDLRLNMPGTMSRQVTITARPGADAQRGLKYREEGELQFGDYRETVHREYDYSFPEAHRACVHFSDGRIFHELDLSTGFFEVEHLCAPDMYHGRFRVDGGDIWLSHWNIKGPAKDLILDNRYQRLI